LVVFGIIQIILGLMACLFIPFVLLTAVFSRKSLAGGMPVGSYVLSVATYALAAIVFITLGVGSIQARRWGHALTLILSWVWLIGGAVSTVMLTVFMPAGFMAGIQASGGSSADMPRGFIAVMLTIFIVFAAIFLVALPIAFVVFYRRKDVEETCRRRDPVERWTDRCPLPVLAVTLLFGGGAVYYTLMSFTTPMIPFFGKYLTGVRGGAACLFLAVLDAFLATFLFRLKLTGWWIAVVALLVRVASAILTFLRGGLLDVYSKMGMSSKQLEMMSVNPALRPGVMIWSSLVFTLLFLGYMIWIKRYFVRPAPASPAAPELLPEVPPG
jgi:uncharacterized membrane protein